MNQQLTFVFVHGLSGWGSYDPLYKKMPYWGMRGLYKDLLQMIAEMPFSK